MNIKVGSMVKIITQSSGGIGDHHFRLGEVCCVVDIDNDLDEEIFLVENTQGIRSFVEKFDIKVINNLSE